MNPAGAVRATSYETLSEDVRRVAAGLRRGGLSDGAPALLWAPNSPEWVIAYFAIVGAGGIVVPLDDQATGEQLQVVLRDSPPERVFTTAGHRAELETAGLPADVPCFLLDAGEDDPASWRRIAAAPAALPEAEPGAVAVLLYTSGTTGTPKGVPLTHENLMNNVRALLDANIVKPDDRLLVPLPLHHAYPATVGMLFVLACGAAMVLPAGISGPELTAAAANARATILIGVPRLYKVLVDSIESGIRESGVAGRTLFPILFALSMALRRAFDVGAGRWLFASIHRRIGPRLRILVSGGARLEPELAAKLEAFGWLVLTGYGLTETSPIVSFNTPRRRKLASQGLAVSGVEIRIDRQPGEDQGEILVRGPNVFSGYLLHEDTTRLAFAEGGWFRTSDLGYLDADGFLYVLGRKTEVIVLSDGKKISPEELERVYEASPYIREVALLERGGSLAAIVVPDEEAFSLRGTMSQQAVLRDELERQAQTLPAYQRVSEFRLARQALPRTRLGKLRRHLLPGIFSQAAAAGAGAASAEPEELLAASPRARAVWQWLKEKYADRDISPDSSPQLDLGIDSLGWVSLTTELEQRFGVTLDTQALSRVLTVHDLLEAVGRAEAGKPAVSAPAAGGRGTLLDGERYLEPRPLPLKILGWVLVLLNKAAFTVLFRLHRHGVEHLPDPAGGPLVLTPNHTSYLDSLAVAAALPLRVVNRACWAGWVGVMHKGRIRRAVSRATRVFPVDPDRDLGGGLRLAQAAIERNFVLVWYPEGRRSPGGGIQKFRPGIGVLLERTHAAAVPVHITGTFDALPVGHRWPRPHRVTVRFGRPASVDSLRAEGCGDDDPARIADGLERRVRALQQPEPGATRSSGRGQVEG